jgi:hypothetical protein
MFIDVRMVRVLISYGPGLKQRFALVEFLHSPIPPDPNNLPATPQ